MLKTVRSPTASAWGKVARTSARLCHSFLEAILYHRATCSTQSPCPAAISIKTRLAMIRIVRPHPASSQLSHGAIKVSRRVRGTLLNPYHRGAWGRMHGQARSGGDADLINGLARARLPGGWAGIVH